MNAVPEKFKGTENAMYRILPKQWIFVFFAWIVVGLVLLVPAVERVWSGGLRISSIPAIAWLIFSTLLINPVWRWVWKRVPALSQWFPDLNGEWDVEIYSNWSRQTQLFEAAAGNLDHFDIRTCPVDQLAELELVRLKAEISQGWWTFEMHVWNPEGDTPIEGSDTVMVDPFAAKGLQPPGIFYFYKQRNVTANVSDDAEFYGAARLTYDRKTGKLTGLAWTARKWARAINTAGPITFTRPS